SASAQGLLERIRNAVRVTDGTFELLDETAFREQALDVLAHAAALGQDEDERDTARWIIGEAGAKLGVRPASIHELYIARGRGEVSGFTVPAMNIRAAS